MRMRNGSAHVLRCLKVWYDLPPDTFFNAVNIMDRFLTRMKVGVAVWGVLMLRFIGLLEIKPKLPLGTFLKQSVVSWNHMKLKIFTPRVLLDTAHNSLVLREQPGKLKQSSNIGPNSNSVISR